MKRVLVLGAFGYHNNQLDGQTIKTRNVYRLLKDNYSGKVDFFCSMQLKKKPWHIIGLIYKVILCRTVIALYASSGGLQTMIPKLYKLTRLLGKRLIYIAIGSGQVDLIEGCGIYTHRRDDLKQIFSKLECFLSETKKVQDGLVERNGFMNVDLFPNFRYFDENIPFSPASNETLRLVFMARITPEKGYDVAFEFFNFIKGKDYNITLDFYGQMDGQCDEDFLHLIDEHKEQGVRYMGVLAPENINTTLLNYDIMLFPTRGDGIPGTIIDGYISSLPVVATNWTYAPEIVDDNETGFIVAYDNPEKQKEFNEAILKLYNDRELLERMKRNAFLVRERYSTKAAWNVLDKYL